MSLKIVFAGTPQFAEHILKRLLDTPHSIIAVYTQPDRKQGRGQQLHASPVKELALEHEIPVYQPVRLKDPLEQEQLGALKPDVMVVVAYGLILPAAVLAIPKYGCLNIHASNLPRWRGAAPIQRAILSGDTETGICIMQMDAGLDTGDVLSNVRTLIYPKDTSESVHDRLADMGALLLIQTLEQLERGTLKPQKQEGAMACYAPKITKEEALIHWDQSAGAVDCKIRAFNPWPVAFTRLGDLNIRIFDAEPIMQPNLSTSLSASAPGTILEVSNEGIIVMTRKGALKLLELQLPGGKRLPVRDILNSKSALFSPGTQFYL